MVNKNDLSVIYTESMQNHSEGHALYKPVSALKLRPAVLGYFDRDGDWQTVLDLADQNALRLGNWLKLELTVGERETGSTIWGPKCSEHVRDINASIRAMAKYVFTAFLRTVCVSFVQVYMLNPLLSSSLAFS